VLGISGCYTKLLPPVSIQPIDKQVSYLNDVAPIMDRRCVVCHSCYDAPCQLTLSSYEGISRGASKVSLYGSARTSAIPPTRLFYDAFSTEAWREKGFYSVTESQVRAPENNSTLLELLNVKKNHPKVVGKFYSGPGGLTCSKGIGELSSYLDKNPNNGMPLGFPPIADDAFNTVGRWLEQGARGPSPIEQEQLNTATGIASGGIKKWEAFFNQPDAKHMMTARYLYEHLFLAHLYFTDSPGEFFRLVRSRTPAPEPIDVISTVLPYDDPGVERVYYRFRKIFSTIVYKTHVVFPLDDSRLERLNRIFIRPDWEQTPHVMSYEPALSANPFAVYRQIPALSRYNFLLDNALYHIRMFVRGPVCKGNIALDVIQDQFWVMFMDPEFDLSIKDPQFLVSQIDNLRLPTEMGVDAGVFDVLDYPYDDYAIDYYKARDRLYTKTYKKGLGYDAIWPGYVADDAPIMTVYRHYNSASVNKGILGNLPRTLWVIDYPLFERIYYNLVAGFDLFSDTASQLNIRRYMDRLRIEGESNFLDFMPKADRKPLFSSWYGVKDGQEIVYYNPMPMPTAIRFKTKDPKRELVTHVVEDVVLPSTNIQFDPINYYKAGEVYPPLPKVFKTEADFVQGMRAILRPGIKLLEAKDGGDINLAFLRLRMPDGSSRIYSLVVNRWHTNVAHIFFEKSRLVPSKDQLNVLPFLVGAYPNFFYDVSLEDLPAFFEMQVNFQKKTVNFGVENEIGVFRSNPLFWKKFDWFQSELFKQQPISAGIYDLTEYYHHAR